MRIVFFVLFLFTGVLHAQISEIKVLDKANENPLIGATLQSNNGNAISDIDGVFKLIFNTFPDTLTIQYVSYETLEIILNSKSDLPETVFLESLVLLETMTVTASKYQKRLSESTVSVEVLKPELIANANTITIDDALDKVSGVQMVDGQANIRGGSGYSYGAGSR